MILLMNKRAYKMNELLNTRPLYSVEEIINLRVDEQIVALVL